MNLYLEHNYSGEAKARMSPMETFDSESCVRFVLVATVGEQLQETQKIRLQWQSLNGSEIVGHIPRKIS